jgi:hypothetical protein
MPRGQSAYHRSSLNGLTMRAARAAEDPDEMTLDATLTRLAKFVAAVLRENPTLDDRQAANAARLRMRAEMAQLSRKSAEARAARNTA